MLQPSPNIALPISTSAGSGITVDVSVFRRFTVYWQDNGASGSWTPEISPDGTNWYSTGLAGFSTGVTLNMGDGIIDSSFTNLFRACGAVPRYFRVKCLSYTSGAPNVILIGEYYS